MENKTNLINIATAPSRKAKRWLNESIEWADLVNRCRTTRRTAETMAEYLAMSREEQTKVKDVGGFVGGFLNGGERRNGSVKFRSVLTLDVDFGSASSWSNFCLAFPGTSAFLYSTHKHNGTTAFRFRLVVLFNRNVKPWEYEPIARRVAEKVGLEMFDGTTFELPRLFFYPSSSTDAPFVFQEQKGRPLDADAILSSYANPKDASQWPHGEKETVTLNLKMKAQGNPTEKGGFIGAFCRAYPIEEAIALTKAYLPTALPNRYTYKEGSVAGGLVTYQGLFAYSHHDSDPASRRLCNAFDLVRIHLFGDKDKGKTYADPSSAPSFKAMSEFARNDKKVKVLLLGERRSVSAAGLTDPCPLTDDERRAVYEQLELGKNGLPVASPTNVRRILENDPNFSGKLLRCDFSGRNYAQGLLPWQRDNGDGSTWNDNDFKNLLGYLDMHYSICAEKPVDVGLAMIFSANRRHPVREYLQKQQWDGQPRLDSLIIDYLGADDTPLNRAMTRKMFIAAVARVMKPGIKFDNCLVLVGGEGIGKSTFLKKMGRDWFTDSLTTMDGKEGMECLRGVWLVEIAELSGLKRSELEQQKNFLSKQSDRYREAYGRTTNEYPRQCVFFGTTNESAFLKGDTGNRRMWVMKVDSAKAKHTDGVFCLDDDYIDQVYAEAFAAYNNNEELFLQKELEDEIRQRQADFNVEADDALPGMLDDFLRQPLPADWSNKTLADKRFFYQNLDPKNHNGTPRTKFCAAEFVCEALGMSAKDRDFAYTTRKVNRLMEKKGGWERSPIRISGYGKQRGWRAI